MPWWLSRLGWMLRRKRRVRVHSTRGGQEYTLEGVRLGCWGGSIVLMLAQQHVTDTETVSLDGVVEVPRDSVIFVQVLT